MNITPETCFKMEISHHGVFLRSLKERFSFLTHIEFVAIKVAL